MSDLPWLKGPAHQCGPRCNHKSGLPKEEGPPEIPVEPSAGNRGTVPRGDTPTLDPICEDCSEPESAHTSPILRDGVVVGLACPTNSCKRFVPRD